MHDIEPHFKWRNNYVASEDTKSPFFDRVYNEFSFTNKIYNYFIHPQWDEFGSPTLYAKILFVDYEEHFAIIEFIGEWNDAVSNDIMFLKRKIGEALMEEGVYKFILICENVLNFHTSDDCYYEEWAEECREENGWLCMINTLDHVSDEMKISNLQHYINFGANYNNINWRPHTPQLFFKAIEALVNGEVLRLA